MTVWRLVIREICHRKTGFLISILSVTTAVACLVGAETLLRADRVSTNHILHEKHLQVEEAVAAKEKIVADAGAELEDAMRKHMLGLGFNILILPKEQSRSELLLNGMTATMPESYVDKLAQSNIVTVNHLLPSVTQRLSWPEYNREIILIGTRGEVPIQHRAMKKELLEEVAEGKMVVGYEIQKELGLKVGDTVTFRKQEFLISAVHPERGSTDDVTLWINLRQAQELLGMQNLINAILALECECAGDRISAVRREIEAILPGTQVIEKYSAALARAEARSKAKESAESSLQQERESGKAMLIREEQSRDQLERQHAGFAAVLVPLVLVASAVTIFMLALSNARQRTEEIGILRAIGLKSGQILFAFLSKATIIGLIGSLLGIGPGFLVGTSVGNVSGTGVSWNQLFQTEGWMLTFAAVPFVAVALTGIASWVPALIAARQDPAVVLQGGEN